AELPPRDHLVLSGHTPESQRLCGSPSAGSARDRFLSTRIGHSRRSLRRQCARNPACSEAVPSRFLPARFPRVSLRSPKSRIRRFWVLLWEGRSKPSARGQRLQGGGGRSRG